MAPTPVVGSDHRRRPGDNASRQRGPDRAARGPAQAVATSARGACAALLRRPDRGRHGCDPRNRGRHCQVERPRCAGAPAQPAIRRRADNDYYVKRQGPSGQPAQGPLTPIGAVPRRARRRRPLLAIGLKGRRAAVSRPTLRCMATRPTGTVSFLFSDVEQSTRLLEGLGPGAYGTALADHRRLLREAFGAHRGYEVDTQGDAFFVAFPTATDAVAAARDGQLALAAHGWP